MVTRKDRKRYSKEFRRQAVQRCEESGKPITEVARELDISVHLLYRWRDVYLKDPNAAFIGSGNSPNRNNSNGNELQQLRRENARLKEERDILKKSLIFFAKDDNNDSNL